MIFWKFQANGNDFVLVNKEYRDENIRKLCHRQYGIGADGVLFVQEKAEGLLYYEHFNADSTTAELCVNGIRCVAFWYFKQKQKNKVQVKIAGVVYSLSLQSDDVVEVEMALPTSISSGVYQVGVLHQMVEVFPSEPSEDRNYDKIRVIDDNEVWVETVERGVGPTLSCGSGMIASYYHAHLEKQVGDCGMVRCRGGHAKIVLLENSLLFSSKVFCVFSGIYFE